MQHVKSESIVENNHGARFGPGCLTVLDLNWFMFDTELFISEKTLQSSAVQKCAALTVYSTPDTLASQNVSPLYTK